MLKRVDGRDIAHVHMRWSAKNPPIITVDPGDVLEIDIPDSSTMQLTRDSVTADLARLDYDRVDAAVGPVYIRGAQPGKSLDVELLDLEAGSWGWSGVFRNFGYLKNRFDDELVVWDLAGGFARPIRGFLRDVRVPVAPMLGVIGVAPEFGEAPMIPPGPFGGNLDLPFNRTGATLRLPIFHEGALLSLGDPHAAQGHGEVCGTGIEAPARARIRVALPDRPAPRFPTVLVPPSPRPASSRGSRFVTTGIAPDLEVATREAVEAMLAAMADEGWSEKEAYLLSSVVGDLRIGEVVDDPQRVVSMAIPAEFLHPPASES